MTLAARTYAPRTDSLAARVMDALITMDRHGIALRAVVWSNAQMQRVTLP